MAEKRNIEALHFITQKLDHISHAEQAKNAILGGVKLVQLRVKDEEQKEWESIAKETADVCKKLGATLVINDNPYIAKAVKAEGLHLGKQDMSPSEARAIVGDHVIIGGTANTFEDILYLSNEGVDYIGFGPFQYTQTKKNLSTLLGYQGYINCLNKMREKNINIPIIAIGGIVLEHIPQLFETGISGIAISGAIARAEEPTESAKNFINEIEQAINNI